ncbi:hypothetical protein FJ651_12920 [Paucihalobacter ruber]|uniref:Uncharacterized protein n=1 Tax=Paucihalobacter ruber TaxID=2567861 RepID=A0A506PG16_9FLAO|nr:DUF6544 family protein [Paucihalobacter ruber]TPV32458.1 hypothetical protein FJ651_12920 [Paucihalobacter ruber]
MRILFVVVIIIHAAIHLLGFVKGFEFKEVKSLTMPISKTAGIFWLLATVLLLFYAISFMLNHKYQWIFGFVAVAISQLLIIFFWKDAKFGTIANLMILVVVLVTFGKHQFQSMVEKESQIILKSTASNNNLLVTKQSLDSVPLPVERWLIRSGVVDKPYATSAKVAQTLQLKMKPDQEQWLSANANQISNLQEPAFIWSVEVKMNPFLNFYGRDKLINGNGTMLIKLNALFNIVNETGPKISEGSMQRYLGEMVWFPTLALSDYVSWQSVNDSTAIATLNYMEKHVSGTFSFNSEGDFIQFSTFRFMGNDPNSQRYEWVLKVQDYNIFEGIKIPSKMTATWKLTAGDWTWLKLQIDDVNYIDE